MIPHTIHLILNLRYNTLLKIIEINIALKIKKEIDNEK